MKAKLSWIVPEPPRKVAKDNLSLDLTWDVVSKAFENVVVDKDYYDYIKHKNVIVVGPADYLRGQGRGWWIDEFDIVVRVNRSFPVNEEDFEDLGSRTDIRYHNACTRENEGGPLHLDNPQIENLEYVSSVFPRHLDYFDNDINKLEEELKDSSVKLHCHSDIEQYITLHHMMETRPNVGIGAILDLVNYRPKRLHIAGFTFFSSEYIDSYQGRRKEIPSEYQNNMTNNHAQGPQRDMIKLLDENLIFIDLDDEVSECVGSNWSSKWEK